MKNLKLILLLIAFVFIVQTNYAQTAADFIQRAQAAQDKGNYAEMVKNANEAVKLDSGNALAYFLRGVGYFLQDKNEEAVADSAKTIELNPNVAPAYFLHSGALIALRPADWKIVLADLDKAIAIDPTYWEYFRERARIQTEYVKDFKNALADANQSIKLNSNDSSAFFVRGRVNQELKNWADAESDYTQAIKLGKHTAKIYIFRGVVYFMQNNSDAAIADFRKSLEIEPNNKLAKDNLELALKKPSTTDSTISVNPPSNKSFAYALNSDLYEKSMPDAEKLFKKLTTHRYPAPKQVSFMGKTEIIDPFSQDKNTLALRLNNALKAMRNLLEDQGNFDELSIEERQLCQERLDKAAALQTDAARLHLVTLFQK